MRAELDTLLLGLIWVGLDGEAQHTDPGFIGDDPSVYGLLLARSPDGVRELAALQCEHGGPLFVLVAKWGHVLTEVGRRGGGIMGLGE
ncbi:hypothetical protein BIV25_38440 [Streptomyces sp. MUSC 14]|uniref:hypothetical protein n=1 Tax=Streptomyces sp. MUSC 14 TaxID=1354889 RepID=UPI00092456EE|nr:hypothetical protein [Streptomyces sp. MUSC 14]OIJ87570.1 hypothetical protein BIV25_38440 [Streptomyces sp. MUSC 14]